MNKILEYRLQIATQITVGKCMPSKTLVRTVLFVIVFQFFRVQPCKQT